jgi:hypothetical protein
MKTKTVGTGAEGDRLGDIIEELGRLSIDTLRRRALERLRPAWHLAI